MTEKTDPQPLTDKEVEAIREHEERRVSCFECNREHDIPKLLARIRADGRRIERLRSVIRDVLVTLNLPKEVWAASDYDEIESTLKAALEDKTK